MRNLENQMKPEAKTRKKQKMQIMKPGASESKEVASVPVGQYSLPTGGRGPGTV